MVLVTAAVALSMWALLAQTHGLRGQARAQARIEAVKTAVTVGAGTGGVVALLLALRRQWLSEHEQVHRERVDTATGHDASERRITELYTAAAGQLGGSAPARLAGLYALERLAQDHTAHRQTIVDLICGYLRLPFPATAPVPTPGPELAGLPESDRAARVTADASAAERWGQERVVRLAAQHMLARHLYVDADDFDHRTALRADPSDPVFWPGIRLNLAGAVLLDFEFAGRRVALANFSGARFIGDTNFAHAEFTDHAFFHDARFENGPGHFLGAWFGSRVVFSGADFGTHQARFDEATFTGMVFLDDVAFGGGVSLGWCPGPRRLRPQLGLRTGVAARVGRAASGRRRTHASPLLQPLGGTFRRPSRRHHLGGGGIRPHRNGAPAIAVTPAPARAVRAATSEGAPTRPVRRSNPERGRPCVRGSGSWTWSTVLGSCDLLRAGSATVPPVQAGHEWTAAGRNLSPLPAASFTSVGVRFDP
ncbi:hypothetical protein GCM10027168_41410 [Streptomyces capparidis]